MMPTILCTYEMLAEGKSIAVLIVSDALPIGPVIDDIVVIIECSTAEIGEIRSSAFRSRHVAQDNLALDRPELFAGGEILGHNRPIP
ncbi:MAG: hypothetical protein R2854_10405 [Caldilineaceae bacterium]